ncbi:MAG TPA: Wzz/FepE/Etk N-terminal domain-containing protein [Chryseolinea sp.]|nr:Wzz/FepE/Etk N-terminal domain-containing protein [Chryseolinea sp.]
MVKTPDSNRSNDEIDLLELLLKVVIIIRDKIWVILIFFIVGAGLGVTYFMAAKKEYESKMIISSNILTTSYAKILFDNANTHLREGDDEVLAKDLKMDAQAVDKIASLQIENLSQDGDSELKESDRYLITVYVYDQRILPSLQRGIVDYLERNEFVRVRVEQQRNYLLQMLSALEKELADLQQFKEEIYNGKFFSNTKGNVMFDPTAVNSKILDLTQKRIEFKNSLELINSVQLIEGFTVFKNPKKPTLVAAIGGGSMLGVFAVGLVVAFKSIRRLLRIAEAKNSQNAA